MKIAYIAIVRKAAEEQVAVQENMKEVSVVEHNTVHSNLGQLKEKGVGSHSDSIPAADGIPSSLETAWVKVCDPRENPLQAVIDGIAEDITSNKDDGAHHTVLARMAASLAR